MATLADIRKRIQEQEDRSQNRGTTFTRDNVIFPHWNAPDGTTAVTRFLPDADPNNEWGFWVERNMIKLPFNGVKGEHNNRQVIVQVPCMDMYGKACPVLAEVRTWYKDPTLEQTANKYWKKRSYLLQGFVRQNPIQDDVPPENPIRRFIMSPGLHKLIKAALIDPELDELPTDYVRGLDFNIRKTKGSSGYSEYDTSNWSRRESPLTQEELDAIDTHGLFNLRDFLPKEPSESELKVIQAMFEASVDGDAYDPEKWAAYYRPNGVSAPSGTENSSAPVQTVRNETVKTPEVQKVLNESSPPFETDEDPIEVPSNDSGKTSADRASDILAMIRSRQTTN